MKKKLPSVTDKDRKPIMFYVDGYQHQQIIKARGDLRKTIAEMFSEAFFDHYLPYEYEELQKRKATNDNRPL